MKRTTCLASVIFFLIAATSAFAQNTVTAADYARAEKMLGYNTGPLVDRSNVRPTFLPNGHFWYRVLTPTGSEYVTVNPADGSRTTSATRPEASAAEPQASSPFAILSPDGKKEA